MTEATSAPQEGEPCEVCGGTGEVVVTVSPKYDPYEARRLPCWLCTNKRKPLPSPTTPEGEQ